MMIQQIIPAIGWAAIYEGAEKGEKDEKATALPLVCWALMDNSIFGMVSNGNGDIVRAEARDGFKSYDYDYEGAVTDYLINNDGQD
jgi:hypothetical protein